LTLSLVNFTRRFLWSKEEERPMMVKRKLDGENLTRLYISCENSGDLHLAELGPKVSQIKFR